MQEEGACRIRGFQERPSNSKRLLTIAEAMNYFNLSRYSLMKIAEANDAVIRIDKVVRINKSKLNSTLGIDDI